MKIPNPILAVRSMTRQGLRWTMWNPARAVAVFGTIAMVLTLGTATYVLTSLNDAMVAVNEKSAALKARKIPPAPTTTSSTPTGGTTTSTSPTSLPSSPIPVAAPPAAASSIDRVARGFIAAWAKGPTAPSDGAWISDMQRWTDPALIDLFRLTDRQQVPSGAKVTAVGEPVIVGDTARVATQVAGVGGLDLTLTADGGTWRVSELIPPDGHEQ